MAELSLPPHEKTTLPSSTSPLKSREMLIFGAASVIICLVTLLQAYQEENLGFHVIKQDGRTMVSRRDFPSHFRFAQSVWNGRLLQARVGEHHSVYSAESHLRMMHDWTNDAQSQVLPFGYSPTFLWLLAALVPLPPHLAFAAWTVLSVAAMCWVVCRGPVHFAFRLLLLSSPLAFSSLRMGQTAMLTLAGLVFLAQYCERSSPRSWLRLAAGAVVLWALTAKPPFAVVAAVALLAGGHLRVVLLAALLTIVTTLAITPWLGPDWVTDYVHLLRHYNADTADPAFAWSLEPFYMTNLRAVLVLLLGMKDAAVTNAMSIIWLVFLAGIVGAGRMWRVCGSTLWGLSLLSYLLISPHVNSTEDLHLAFFAVVFILALDWPPLLPGLATAALIWLSPWNVPAALAPAALVLVVVGKAGLFGVLIKDAVLRRGPSTVQAATALSQPNERNNTAAESHDALTP
jgi:hypothetical protein